MTETLSLTWTGAGAPVTLSADAAGEGETVLLLPALSSISTRKEMSGLLDALSPHFRAVAVDWPGFGDGPKPRADWTPDLLSAWLAHVLTTIAPRPYAIVAAGHAATYACHHLAAHPGAVSRLVSIAPTWRGPFPTMMKGHKPWFGRIRAAVDVPVLGSLLYAINLSGPVIDRMVSRHVYSDPAHMSPEAKAAHSAVARARGARYGSVRFVTGGLDRVATRAQFLDLARAAAVPTLLVYGAETPPRSKAEMEALAALPGVEIVAFEKGRLSLHEEFPREVGPAVRDFLLAGRAVDKPS